LNLCSGCHSHEHSALYARRAKPATDRCSATGRPAGRRNLFGVPVWVEQWRSIHSLWCAGLAPRNNHLDDLAQQARASGQHGTRGKSPQSDDRAGAPEWPRLGSGKRVPGKGVISGSRGDATHQRRRARGGARGAQRPPRRGHRIPFDRSVWDLCASSAPNRLEGSRCDCVKTLCGRKGRSRVRRLPHDAVELQRGVEASGPGFHELQVELRVIHPSRNVLISRKVSPPTRSSALRKVQLRSGQIAGAPEACRRYGAFCW